MPIKAHHILRLAAFPERSTSHYEYIEFLVYFSQVSIHCTAFVHFGPFFREKYTWTVNLLERWSEFIARMVMKYSRDFLHYFYWHWSLIKIEEKVKETKMISSKRNQNPDEFHGNSIQIKSFIFLCKQQFYAEKHEQHHRHSDDVILFCAFSFNEK